MSQSKRPTPKGAVPPRGGNRKGGPRPATPSAGRPVGASSQSKSSSGAARQQTWERRRHQRNQRYLAMGGVIVVVVVVAALIIVKSVTGNGSAGTTVLPTAVEQQVTGISTQALVTAATSASATASGSGASPPSAISGPSSLGGDHPKILYIGAEYCPYCAAERWPMVMALSKFGTFTGLRATTSSSTDTNADTPTFSFANATYTSSYLSFTGRETEDRLSKPLQKLTAAETALVSKYDTAPYVSSSSAGSIPFILFGSQYVVSGSEYDGAAIAGQSIENASQLLTTPATAAAAQTKQGAVALAAQAAAGHIMGAICSITNNKPPVCASVPASLKPSGTSGGGSTSSSSGSSTSSGAAG